MPIVDIEDGAKLQLKVDANTVFQKDGRTLLQYLLNVDN